MNALVGQEAKLNVSLSGRRRDKGADDSGRKDGGDFASTGAGTHLCRRCKFEVLHDGSRESKPSGMMCADFRSGSQRRSIGAARWRLNGGQTASVTASASALRVSLSSTITRSSGVSFSCQARVPGTFSR